MTVTMTACLHHDARRGADPRPAKTEPDLLSLLLEPCRFRSVVSRPSRLTAPWGIEAPQSPPGFYLVLDGSCELQIDDGDRAYELGPYDLAIITRTGDHWLRDRAETPTVPLSILQGSEEGAERRGLTGGGGGMPTRFLRGSIACEDDYTRQMLTLLPPVVVLQGRGGGVREWFAPLVESLLAETETERQGSELVLNRLLQILLVQTVRQASVDLPENSGGLLAALRTPGLGSAVGSIHARPDHDWSVHELAEIAGLSRAAFAARFLETVGRPPFQYLRDVRMRMACRLLRDTDRGIKEVAGRVGYATEASFSKAFTRWSGRAPGSYRRQSRRRSGNDETGASHPE